MGFLYFNSKNNKSSRYSTWQIDSTVASLLKSHVDMIEALEQIMKTADSYGTDFYTIDAVDKDEILKGDFVLNCKILDPDDKINYTVTQYLGTENEYLLSHTLWSGLSESQIEIMKRVQYSVDDSGDVVVKYYMPLPCVANELDYIIRAFAEEIHQRLPNDKIIAGQKGIVVSTAGPGVLEISRHLKY